MSTAATTTAITPDEFYRMGDAGKGFELVNGELKELKVSNQSSRVGGRLYRAIENFSEAQFPGWVFPPETGFRCFADDRGRVRKPDTAFIAHNRMTVAEYYEDGFNEVVPDLVAEVVSPNDNAEELEEKIEEWVTAGVKVVWVITPATRTVRVHRADGGYAFLRATDTLTAPDILPGFSVPVADLFRLPADPAPAPAPPV
jgi:Uma2 family endonuclease